jgi:hypothetical protein
MYIRIHKVQRVYSVYCTCVCEGHADTGQQYIHATLRHLLVLSHSRGLCMYASLHCPHIHHLMAIILLLFAPHRTSVHRAITACCRIDGTAPSAHTTALPPAFQSFGGGHYLALHYTIIVLESSYCCQQCHVTTAGVCQTTTTREPSNSGRS